MDATESSVVSEAAAARLADAMRPILAEFERDADRAAGHMRELRSALRSSDDSLRTVRAAYELLANEHQSLIAERAQLLLRLERAPELTPRPKAHWHDPDDPEPVIVMDLDKTLRPTAAYPMVDEPFIGVKQGLDRLRTRGCCLHIATGGTYYGSEDMDLAKVRQAQIEDWCATHGLPIGIVLPKVVADVYLDDRMIFVPPDPDWKALVDQVEEALTKRFDLKGNQWQRKPKDRIGKEIEDWPDYDTIPPDQPRGFSGAKLDIDFHRTLSTASSSLREAPPQPDAIKSIAHLYGLGVTIQLSCAGWNPADHDRNDARRRVAALRQWCQLNGVNYDRIVAKDHGDVYLDDKGIRYEPNGGGWKKALPAVIKRLEQASGTRVQDSEREYEPYGTDLSQPFNDDLNKTPGVRKQLAVAAKEKARYAQNESRATPPETAEG